MMTYTSIHLIPDPVMILEGETRGRSSYGRGYVGTWSIWTVHTESLFWCTLSGPICAVDKPGLCLLEGLCALLLLVNASADQIRGCRSQRCR